MVNPLGHDAQWRPTPLPAAVSRFASSIQHCTSNKAHQHKACKVSHRSQLSVCKTVVCAKSHVQSKMAPFARFAAMPANMPPSRRPDMVQTAPQHAFTGRAGRLGCPCLPWGRWRNQNRRCEPWARGKRKMSKNGYRTFVPYYGTNFDGDFLNRL